MLLATWISAPPQAGEKDERRFEKRNLCSRVPRLRVHVAVFWSDAKSRAVLGGTLGENAAWCSGHGSSAQEDGCGLSPAAGPARHVVLCGHRSVFSSPPGRRNVSPPRIFSTNPPKVGIDKEQLHRALQFLHATGSVLHYGSGTRQHSQKLQEVVFMQPQFIIDLIKYVIRESRGEDVNDELRAMDAQIRQTSLRNDLDRLFERGEVDCRQLCLRSCGPNSKLTTKRSCWS